MKKIALFIGAFAIALSICPSSVFADGMMIKPDLYNHFDYSVEKNQQAFINYDKGLQKMILSIEVEGSSADGAVWLFPVPSDPSKISIDVVNSLPQLYGEEISGKAKTRLDDIMGASLYSVFPFLFVSKNFLMQSTLGLAGHIEGSGDVSVYSHIEENGLITEVLTAKTPDALYGYLRTKGISITHDSLPVLNHYIGNEFSFIVSWVDIPALQYSNSFIEQYLEEYTNGKRGYHPKLSLLLKKYETSRFSFEAYFDTKKEPYRKLTQSDLSYLDNWYAMNPDASPMVLEALLYEYWTPEQVEESVQLHQLIQGSSTFSATTSPFSKLAKEVVSPYCLKHRSQSGCTDMKVGKEKLDAVIASTQKSQEILREIAGFSNQKGVFVSFPTDKLYFPLIPTSMYGDKIVPATIRVFGYVTPEVFANIKNFTDTTYYEHGLPPGLIISVPPPSPLHFNGYQESSKPVDTVATLEQMLGVNFKTSKYTKIHISAPSNLFTEDLWMTNKTPFKTYFSTFVSENSIPIGILFFLLSSALSGVLAGMVFPDLRKNPFKLARIGILNMVSIFGVAIAIFFSNTKAENVNIAPLLLELKEKGYVWKSRASFFLHLILILMSPIFVFFGIFGLINSIYMFVKYHSGSMYLFTSLGITMLFLFLLSTSFILIRQKKEDQILFQQLDQAGYSRLTFVPKDPRKIRFIPLFALSFYSILWALIEFLKTVV